MIDLNKIIEACNLAIDDTDDNFSNSIPFFELADPRAVLELANSVRAGLGDQELARLITLIRNLADCLSVAAAAADAVLKSQSQELISQVDCILAIYDEL